MFFMGKVVLSRWRWIDRFLFSNRGEAIQQRLERRGIPHVVLLVGALTFLPALALGPIAEALDVIR